MSQSAYIQLVRGSAADSITLEDVIAVLERYQEQTTLTGKQLDWDYTEMAFPYTIERRNDQGVSWLYLKGNNQEYRSMLIGVGTKQVEDDADNPEQQIPYIQIVLPDGATHGDKSKANEYCKYLGRTLKAQVKMFNGRTMYYNSRK